MKITILGAGVFGITLGNILKSNQHEVNYYDPIKFKNQSLSELLEGTKVIIYCAPSEAAANLLPLLPVNLPLICASKGFIEMKQFESFPNFGVMSGGTIASSLRKKLPSTFTITNPLVSKLFSSPYLKFQFSSDTFGVILCGAFKNVYAILAGYNNLIENPSSQETFFSAARTEIRSILSSNHCDPNTFNLSCGVSDLKITCLSLESRNYQYGMSLNQDSKPLNYLAEGVSTVHQLLHSKSFIKPSNTPLLDQTISLIKGATNAAK